MSRRQDLEKTISALLGEQWVLTLAFTDEIGPWASPVFYAADGFDLYFVSGPDSRHCRHIEAGGTLAAAIDWRSENWLQIKGLQMEGNAHRLAAGEQQSLARRVYTGKFPFTKIFFDQAGGLPAKLAERIAGVRFYRFRPERLVLVDNSVSFGYHAELRIGG